MDIQDTIAPKSEQLDAIDLVPGERTFTVREVKIAAGEQPANVYFEEFPRPWRPGVNMRRVLSDLWGKGRTWPGHRITLYCDPDVQFGGKAVGGVRIRAMSHIGDKPRRVLILASQGRPDFYRVEPLADLEAASAAPVEKPLTDRIEAATAAYARAAVTVQMLEAKVALPREEWAEQTVANLEALYARLVARETTKEAEFDMPGDDQ